MPISLQDVKAILDQEEPNYSKAAQLGADAMPFLETLAGSSDVMLASKATYLASLIPGGRASAVLEKATQHQNAVVRVAAAAGLQNLPSADAARLAQKTLLDSDAGVRKASLSAIETAKLGSMKTHVERLATGDPEPFLREQARRTIGIIPQ